MKLSISIGGDNMHREDFPMLDKNIIYFDNGATTFKPKEVIDAMNDYYTNYTANAHRGDYDISLEVDSAYEAVRENVRDFIHADSCREIVFTSGTTDSLNMAIFGYFKNVLHPGDEVLITESEHASNILPWYVLMKEIGIKVKYIPLNEHHEVTLSNVEKSLTEKTKVISLAHITNVIGDVRPIHEIGLLAKKHHIYFVVDAAQSIAHHPLNVQSENIDFLAFSAHKMYGPTGVGVLYGKEELLDKLVPRNYGGGMNIAFTNDGKYELKELPSRLEAGTSNVAGVIGLGKALEYVKKIGITNILSYEKNLRKYLIERLEEIPNVIVYNKDIQGSIVAFNIKDIFSQDTSIYLNKYHICVRAGNHCAKILKNVLKIANTCRISLAIYNNKEEIDLLINVLKNNKNIWNEIL